MRLKKQYGILKVACDDVWHTNKQTCSKGVNMAFYKSNNTIATINWFSRDWLLQQREIRHAMSFATNLGKVKSYQAEGTK